MTAKKKVSVVLNGPSQGGGRERKVDAERAAELVAAGVARYADSKAAESGSAE